MSPAVGALSYHQNKLKKLQNPDPLDMNFRDAWV